MAYIRLYLIAAAVALALAGCHDKSDRFKPTSSGSQPFVAPTQAQDDADDEPTQPTPALRSITSLGGGFVWKPVSEGDGNLVVLLPASSGVVPVAVNRELGRFIGRTNGNRPTYRFSRPGAAYPPGSILTIGSLQVVVPNPGQRYD